MGKSNTSKEDIKKVQEKSKCAACGLSVRGAPDYPVPTRRTVRCTKEPQPNG
jgi:ribosomal protein L34E